MRSKFALTLLTSAILLSGCSSSPTPEVGLVPSASQYDDRMLDSLGSQRYTEQQKLYMRKVQSLEHELDTLEQKRKALEASMGLSQLEADSGKIQASDSEAVRMTDFAAATQESQTRLAAEAAEHAVEQSLIENDRDRLLMEAELEANRRMAELDEKYIPSIQSAGTDAEKARLNSELEIEKAKAEAQRKKALIEANATRDLSRLDQDYQNRISDAKQSAVAFNQAATQESQSQRIKIALANADSQRRVKDDIASTQTAITNLVADKQSAAQPLHDEISKLNEQIIALQGRVATIESGFDSKIAIKQASLDSLQSESAQLAAVEQSLINAPVMSATLPQADAASREVLRLESALQKAKDEVLVNKSNLLAEVDQQLSSELDKLSARISIKSSNETAIRSELAVKRTSINNEARSQIAKLTVKSEIAKAGVVAPVLTNRAVYAGSYGEKPAAFAAKQSSTARELIAKAKTVEKPPVVAKAVPPAAPIVTGTVNDDVAPLVVASTFEPKAPRPALNQVDDVVIATGVMAGGDLKPLVVAPSATTYTVIYSYAEKGSAEKFMAYLRAYGVNDFIYRYSEKLGQHVLFMGKYTSKDQAASRVAFLNKTTSTANAKVVESDL